ncbi:hypothetical protein [Paenibacillus wenxiniae]|uniref:Uncharacterized protein n=1 Tax=Paenibacillus wenxiniae TaxID=1636843 RepID=A0ABW4RE72_9BACL
MSRFEKLLIKYMSYGFVVGLFYSFLANRVVAVSTVDSSAVLRSPLDEYIMDALFNATLVSVIVGALVAISYWANPPGKR